MPADKTKDRCDFVQRFQDHCRKQAFFQSNDRVLVAVSGGMDSVVLLHAIHAVGHEWQLQVGVIHLNHMIRGPESDRDDRFVRALCQRLSLPLFVERSDVPAYCRTFKKSIEMGAREVRYDFFERVCHQQRYRYVLTAHHANDQAETILSNVMRGAGLAGLRGIPPRRDIFLRPLLPFTRHELSEYAAARHLDYVHDSSNSDPGHRRNRIRHELIPLLQESYNPHLVSTLAQLGSHLFQVEEWVKVQAKEGLHACLMQASDDKIILDIDRFLAYFKVLQKYILGLAIDRLAGCHLVLDHQRLDRFFAMLDKRASRKHMRLNEKVWVRVEPRNIVFFTKRSDRIDAVMVPSYPCTVALWQGWIVEIKAEHSSLKEILKNSDSFVAWVDASSLHFPLVIRPPRPGDRFYPLNLGHCKKISDFFIDEKVAFYKRHGVPVVFSRDQVVWIAGYRLDDRFKVTEETTKTIMISLRRHE